MKRLFSKNKTEKGAVTVEAAIVLPIYLFAFLIIFSIVSVCRAQARIQTAINSTAKEISQYSYLYGLSGMDEVLADFEQEGMAQKDKVNNLATGVVSVFNSIQGLGGAAGNVEVDDIEGMLGSWENIKENAGKVTEDAQALGEQVEALASDPKGLLLGMAKMATTEGLELLKSRAIAEPIARALVQKHLIRSEDDTADKFCKSVGIVPGEYWGKKSYFNGLDFSNSTLFPYGNEEITIVVTYKITLLQLLPIDLEYTITQTAVTKGWLHGDKGSIGNTSAEKIDAITDPETQKTIWSHSTVSDRNSMIVSEKLDKLKSDGYNGVSGETYIQAYDVAENKVVMVGSANPMYGYTSVSEIDKDTVKEDIRRRVAQIESSTHNRVYINIKEKNADGSITTKKVDCTKKELQKEIILVVPENEGLKAYVEGVINELGYMDLFTVEANHGVYVKATEETSK